MSYEEMFNLFMQEIKGINNKMDKLDHKMQDIKVQLNRIEENQQQEVMGMLKVVDKKVTNISYDIDYLREQTSKHDMDIERIKKQIQS